MRNIRTVPIGVAAVATLLFLPVDALVGAQQATPATGLPAAGASLAAPDGTIIGTATFTEGDDARVTVTVTVLQGLAPGEHGIHVHGIGSCDPSGEQPFASAGDHFNPTGAPHPEHAGDLGNIAAMANGSAQLQLTTDRFTLSPGPASLQDADGSALLIHEGRDDERTDPSGNSGGRIACGVIELNEGSVAAEGTPAASPLASPAAPGGVPAAEASPPASPVAAAAGGPITLEGYDIGWRYDGQSSAPGQPVNLTVAPGATISLPNVGVIPHSFVVDALGLNQEMPVGQTVEVTIPADAAPGDYEYYCDVPGHEPAGMVGTLTIG
jgi:Cu-Zn family superoxide dismutase